MAMFANDHTAPETLNESLRIHVADIRDNLISSDTSNKHIEAAVQLVWPFSSTNSQLSLLLIEKDVSFRETAAQLRVTFHDACAKEVAKSRIGIGDIVKLDLKDGLLENQHEELSTPGKKTGFDLHFRKHVHIQVGRCAKD